MLPVSVVGSGDVDVGGDSTFDACPSDKWEATGDMGDDATGTMRDNSVMITSTMAMLQC